MIEMSFFRVSLNLNLQNVSKVVGTYTRLHVLWHPCVLISSLKRSHIPLLAQVLWDRAL
jgi:hypothetical protein